VQHWDVATAGRDVAYLDKLLTHVEQSACVDLRRIYFAGLSNGAWMTSAVACKLAARVAAVAPVAGIQDFASCHPHRAVPVVTFHGTADRYVAYQGGWGAAGWKLSALDDPAKTFEQESAAHRPTTFGPLPASIPGQIAGWARRNGCGTRPRERRVAPDVTLVVYPCAANASVEFYRVTGGGHSWPGSKTNAALASLTGPTTLSIDANDIIWRFFRTHPLDGPVA
jgi:polyhydroxybutyrate depolymerase